MVVARPVFVLLMMLMVAVQAHDLVERMGRKKGTQVQALR